jgi:hypothetical protein
MSKWESETFELESKLQLKAHREHKWKVLLFENNLNMLYYPFFTPAEIALEEGIWKLADNDYETRKEVLRGQLTALAANELVVYFQEIGVSPSSITDYLPLSPHTP